MEESRDEMINFLEKKCKKSELKCYQEIHIALESIIKCVVQNYHFDSRIRDVYQFPDKIKRILDQYKDISYMNIGAYRLKEFKKAQKMLKPKYLTRPDFLYDDKIATIKICEINARFPTNGYPITFFGNEFETNRKHSSKKLPAISHFINDYKNYFDFSQPVCILKDKESNLKTIRLKSISSRDENLSVTLIFIKV
ncbi:hypothetical protein BpHYR1_051195 [Brachionus plicatilis]|uniref:Uncharacterized protein n=1 Tax=Brachionus plicatilis TaxID=10195 RepID=A0A3M7S472_BRAPC|nr:hypothetical protein BpHYR1_051195 [Brachionus plicatilis]